ncbi:MAG: hypothetical protein GEU79_01355 [Acidimicrobiia bacterium]|nr:hypothetical protein [Acidimicrobiia bacterium]
MRFRSTVAILVLLGLAACGGGGAAEGALPIGEHVHSLGLTTDGELLLGLHGGLYRSEEGESWELAGLEGEDAMVIAASGEPLFVAGHEVLYRSEDGGQSFTPLDPPDLPGLDIHAFTQAPDDGTTVYAFVVGHGLYASGDAGESWEQRAPLEQLPRDLLGLAVVGSGSDSLVTVGPESGILYSDDGGRTLTRVAETPTWAVTADPSDADHLWSLGGTGLLRSDDGAQTWEGVSDLAELDGQPITLTVGEEAVWVVTEEPRALYSSRDQGKSWERVAGA